MNQSQTRLKIKDILESVIGEMVDKGIFWHEALAEFEKLFILRVLQQSNGKLSQAADTMGVHRNTLSKKIREHAIEKQRSKNKQRAGARI